MAKKVLVTGAGGLLGSEFVRLSDKHQFPNFSILPFRHAELDITSPDQVEARLDEIRPDYLINCAAYTNVDGAELEKELATRINLRGVEVLAKSCFKRNIKLIHYSTNSVFDGQKKSPYLESDPSNPIGAYGLSKLESEKKVVQILPPEQQLILRITWPYGENGKNFINNAIRQLSDSEVTLRAVTDQVGTPNPAPWLARQTLVLMEDVSGLFHLCCRGTCSKYELISFLISKMNSKSKVEPALTSDFPSPAKRPYNSSLETERKDILNKIKLPTWQEALLRYLDETACL